MKTYAALAAILTLLALGSAVRAQSCYTPITSWQGNYSLKAKGSAACAGNSICTINQAAAANTNLALGGVSCTELLEFTKADSVTSDSMDNTLVEPCGNGQQLVDTYLGTDGWVSSSQLNLNISKGGFSYIPVPAENATFTVSGCASGSINTFVLLYPGSNWPPTFALPASAQPLTVDNFGFQAWALVPANITVPWTFSFNLTPKYNGDDDCNQDGGPGVPVSSRIGCQNQSLGEDVPIVGTGFHLHYDSDRAPGTGADSIASTAAFMIGGWTLNIHHAYDPATNTLFLGDGRQRNGYQLGTPVSFNGDFLLTSEDGGEVYVFTSTGQHLQTLRPLTGALEYKFGYDSAGKLVTVTDGSGNVTTIQRNGSEQATSIVSPFGQTTTLSLDSNGFLSQVTDPLAKSATFTHTSTGLLTSRTDENGNLSNYTYDDQGGLARDADPLGGYTALTRTNANSGLGWTVAHTTSMGRTSSFQSTLTLPWVENNTSTHTEQQSITWPNGLQATKSTSLQSGQLSKAFTLPDGTSDSTTLGPDPVWGIQVPVTTSEALTHGNLTMNISASRSTTLGTPGNPFTVSTETDTRTINGRTYTSVFTGSSKTYVNTTPVKRNTTTILDSLERISSVQVGALLAVDYSYDAQGRLATIKQGTRTTTLGYDANGFLISMTDALKNTTGFTHDADGHVLTSTLPDGRVITFTYDANGNLTSVTPPGKSAHSFSYTAVDLLSIYAPPTAPGTGSTSYAYNADRDLTTVTRPDGETITYSYDSAGRLSSITTPTETANYSYDATTGNLSGASIAGGEAIAYGYNGSLPTSATWTGTVAGGVSRVYNDNFWVTSESINGGNIIPFQHDNDGLLTKAGALSLKYSANNPLLLGTSLGAATDSRTYNGFGELTGYTAMYNGAADYTVTLTRDSLGRVAKKTETIGGATNTHTYAYDPAGRLTGVAQNGKGIAKYTYDSNSNRLTAATSSGTVTGTYDAQDRLLTYGKHSYTYTANGELASRTTGTQTTTYTYDVLGNLMAATLPNGNNVSYVVDANKNRVGKKVNGTLMQGFLFDRDRIVAQLNSSSAILSQFIYASRATTPDYMVAGGVTYRIFSDQLGSPRLVVNSSTGGITEQINYDEFGNVISDTNPGFQPFGFAGGLYDQDTKLVRFGARDYDPSTARWTAKDPIRFGGGDANLYGYVLNDPVNMADPSGRAGEDCVCSMPAPPTPPKAVPFVNYTPGAAEIQAAIQAALNGTGPGPAPATSSERSDPGSISKWAYDLPNYGAPTWKGNPLKAINDIGSIGKKTGICRRPISPAKDTFNPSEVNNQFGADQEVEPTPDAPETVVEPIAP